MMTVFGRSTQFINRRMADINDSLTLARNDFSGGFSGFITGDSVYRRVRASSRSYFLRALLDTKLSRLRFRTMHRCAKRLEFYGGHEFEMYLRDIFERYSDDPVKLQRKSEKIVGKVIDDLDQFSKAYEEMLSIVRDELLKDKQMLLLQDELLSSLFSRLKETMVRQNVYIPESLIEEARGAFIRALSSQLIEEKGDVMEDASLQNANYVRKGFLARLMGTGFVIHKAKKTVKSWNAATQYDFAKYLDQVERQLNEGNINPTTFSLLVSYAKDLPRNDDFMREITHDAKLVLAASKKLLESVLKSMTIFLSMFKGIRDVDEALSRLSKLKELQTRTQIEVNQDRSDAMRLADQINRLHGQLKVHFADLIMASRRVRQAIGSDPSLVLRPSH